MQSKRHPRRCSICRGQGHDARNCQAEKVSAPNALPRSLEPPLPPPPKVLTDAIVGDPTFWDYETRQAISRELLEFRRNKKCTT